MNVLDNFFLFIVISEGFCKNRFPLRRRVDSDSHDYKNITDTVLKEDNAVSELDSLDVFNLEDEERIASTVKTLDVSDILDNDSSKILNTTELAAYFGYKSKEHTVITSDGYYITIFRIFGRHCSTYSQTPVLLLHGLVQSSDAWLMAGPDVALGLLLADSCFPTWIGNQRGNTYGRKHITLDPDNDEEFWDFTYDEMGIYDTPAMIDYVLENSNTSGLNLIGYSQSGATVIAMCSDKPEYCTGEKVRLFIAMAPAAFMTHMTSEPLRISSKIINDYSGLLVNLGYNRFFKRGSLSQQLYSKFCSNPIIRHLLCLRLVEKIDKYTVASMSNITIKLIPNYIPDGTSIWTQVKYYQAIYKDFRWYDYGDEEKNIARYGTSSPPEYYFENVLMPSVIIRGLSDHMSVPRDVALFADKLPNLVAMEDVPDPHWNHFDSGYSAKIPFMTYPIIQKYLNLYN